MKKYIFIFINFYLKSSMLLQVESDPLPIKIIEIFIC